MASAVVVLQQFIDSSDVDNETKARIDLNIIWEKLKEAASSRLENCGWIINGSESIVRFYVYNANDFFLNSSWLERFAIQAHFVDIQPGEMVEVHGGMLKHSNVELKVKRNDEGTQYNITRNKLYLWTGTRMIQKQGKLDDLVKEHHQN